MANKLKNIFNNELVTSNGKIRFYDDKAFENFNKALNDVYENGETVHVSEKVDISINVDDGASVFPYESSEKVSEMFIFPAYETCEILIDLDGEKKKILVNKCFVKEGFIIKTKENNPFEIIIKFNKIDKKVSLSFKPHIENASSVEDAYINVKYIQGLLNVFFCQSSKDIDDNLELLRNALDQFLVMFDRLLFLEKTFEIRFNPSKIDLFDEEGYKVLSEICLLVREKKIIRKNAKLKSIDGKIELLKDEIVKKANLAVSFLNSSYFELWEQKIKVYSVLYLGNAIVKDIIELEDGNRRVIYGDDELNPMFVACKSFITEDDAKKELENIKDHEDEYKNAKTFEYYYYGE